MSPYLIAWPIDRRFTAKRGQFFNVNVFVWLTLRIGELIERIGSLILCPRNLGDLEVIKLVDENLCRG